MRHVQGRICREQDVNLQLHLQHLSEEQDCMDEWMFVESRLVEKNEHNVCPCGQKPIDSYYFKENKINGNRTFVGSTCLGRIDPTYVCSTRIGRIEPQVVKEIAYFKHILENEIQGKYRGEDSRALQRFTVRSNTILVECLHDVKHLNPPIIRNQEGEWEVLVKHPKREVLVEGQAYQLKLKTKYQRGRLIFTVV